MNDLTQARKLIKECHDTQNLYLDLGKCGITDLYALPELFKCTHLEALILSNSWWEDTHKTKYIKSKNSGKDNKINSLPRGFKSLINLKKFLIGSLGEFGIDNIDVLFNCKKLEYLDARSSKIKDISIVLELRNLKTIFLSSNKISNTAYLKDLSGLENLDVSYNGISDISFLEKLTGLKSLSLRSNEIFDISVLEKLTILQSLNLSNNQISDISFLGKLTGLQSLNLSSNEIFDINVLEKLTGLQSLNLSSNEIFDINVLEKLVALQSLNLNSNEISDISFLEKLSGLLSLDLSSNQISDISFIAKLIRLQSLDLHSNQISDIGFIEKLTKLQFLYLSNNQISDISFIEKLTKLQFLDLSDNEISDIRFIEKLTRLKSLDLHSNQIFDVSYLEKLTELQSLDLRLNNLKKIPLSIFQLKMEINMNKYGIEGLCIYSNPIEEPPLVIIMQGKQSVLDWFEATKKKLNEIKVILIGEPGAGKTSLLKRLKFGAFKNNEVQTDGVNIEDIEFGKCDSFKKQKSLHSLTGHFWDFGGQEIMNATHQFFLTKRSVYVLVLDARKDANSSSQIREWVKRVKATGGDSPIIVLANQIDINPGFGFENERELQDEFSQIKCFIKVSCSTNENIELLKTKLAKIIPTAELFKTEIDERWIEIKDKLQKETKATYFLDETQFLAICNELNLKEKQGQKYAITFLHDLGLVLHFDDLNLSEYYVLNPYWITYGVYQILTSAYVSKMKGEVSTDKLEYIVNEEEDKREIYNPANYKKIKYAPNQRRFLIDILHQFKLCFCATDHSYFIIPDLLDTKEPLDITENIRASSENIQFVYEYEYLPKSIMPNIIVETHQIIAAMWRTGCVLQNDGCKALITNYQNRISITVTGEHKRKREFMSVIRFLLDSINQKLSNKPVALIPLPSVNAFVKYERLLAREKSGKTHYIFDEDMPTEKSFLISELLEGIPTNEEVRVIGGLQYNKEFQNRLERIESGINEIKHKLDSHYEYLINLPKNSKIKNGIQEAIKEMNTQQTSEITDEIMNWITTAFEIFDDEMDYKLKEIYRDLKKTDDVQAKLKLSVPFINMIGINFETELNVKSWAKKMYKKHKLKIFKLMGVF